MQLNSGMERLLEKLVKDRKGNPPALDQIIRGILREKYREEVGWHDRYCRVARPYPERLRTGCDTNSGTAGRRSLLQLWLLPQQSQRLLQWQNPNDY